MIGEDFVHTNRLHTPNQYWAWLRQKATLDAPILDAVDWLTCFVFPLERWPVVKMNLSNRSNLPARPLAFSTTSGDGFGRFAINEFHYGQAEFLALVRKALFRMLGMIRHCIRTDPTVCLSNLRTTNHLNGRVDFRHLADDCSSESAFCALDSCNCHRELLQ